MGNPNLTPTVITDVNGRVTTVHKRAQTTGQGASGIPAPIASRLKMPKAYKPTPEQNRNRHFGTMVWNRRIDPALAAVTGLSNPPYNGIHSLHFLINDVDAYAVLSVAGCENAVALMEHGIKSREDATRFLEDNKLAHLIEDNSAVMDMALRRKLKSAEFYRFYSQMYSRGMDAERFVDAAEAESIAALRNKRHNPPIPQLVLDGELSLTDLKTMTAGLLNSTNDATIRELIAINKGERDYDAKQLRLCLQDYRSYLMDDEMLKLVHSCGMAFTRGIRAKKRAYSVYLETEERYRYSFKLMDVITYNDILDIYGRKNENAKDVVELFESGVAADFAAKKLNEGMTIPQIIAIGTQDAPTSISSGWL